MKGRSFFAGRIGESVAVGGRHAGRRPDRPPRLRGGLTRRRGAGLPAQRPHLRGRAAHVRVRHGVGPPGRDGLHRVGGAGRLRRHTLGRVPGPGARPRDARAHDEILAAVGRRALRAVGHRRPLGRQPGERRLLRGGRGADDRRAARWRSRCGRSPSPRRCSACCSRSSRSAPTCAGCPGVAAGQTLAIADMALSGD